MTDVSATNWDDVEKPGGDAAPEKPRVQRWMVLGVVTLAIFVRGRAAEEMQRLNRDPQGYRQIAEGLWGNYHTFGLFLYTSQPIATANRAPLYPLVLAPWVVFGEGTPLAVACIHLLLGGVTVWLVWRLGCRWNLPQRVALLAAGLIAIDPILLNRTGRIAPETLATALVLVALHALTWYSDRPTRLRAGLAGACLGLCTLCQSSCLAWLLCCVVFLPAILGRAYSWPTRVSHAVICLLGAAIVLAPWVIRNQTQFGAPIVTTTRGGYALLSGNNPSYYEHLRSGAWMSDWDAHDFTNMWGEELSQVARDEVSRDRRAYAVAWRSIRDEPAMFLLSCVAHAGSLWGLVPYASTQFEGPRVRSFRYATGLWYTIEFLFAALGVHALGKRVLRTPWLWGVLLVLSMTAVHAVFWGYLHDRASFMPVLALLAALGARSLWVGRQPIKLFS